MIYNVSTDEMYLLLNYNNISDNMSSIKIVASNDYSRASVVLPVVPEDTIPYQSKWHIYVFIGLGGLILVGVVYGVVRYVLNKRRKKP